MHITFFHTSAKCINWYEKHTHKCWVITYMVAGNVSVTADGQVFNLNAGDIIIFPPYVVRSGISNSSFIDVSIGVSELDFSDVFVVHDRDETIGSLFLFLLKVMLEKESNHNQIANSLLSTIYLYIKKFNDNGPSFSFVQTLKNIIYNDFKNENFSIENALNTLGYNNDYIRKCFKKETNKTPHEYMISLRIEYAKKLLTQENFISIEHTASQCGFADSFYFSTCFKKHTGISPLRYRKQALKYKILLP